jgi:hypothetical protein
MGEVPKVCDIEDVYSRLYGIGLMKNDLPSQLRGWVPAVGLYVQLRRAGGWRRLAAGGKFRSCFDALCRDYVCWDFPDWEVRKFDKKRWERDFAHLVYPTTELTLFLDGMTGNNHPGFQSSDQNEAKFMAIVTHFKKTGEWLGLLERRCATCAERIMYWDWQAELCPYCEDKLVLSP